MTHSFETARQHFEQGVEYHEAGLLVKAEQAFLASLALLPGRATTLLNLGATQLALGRAPQALQSLDASLAADPNQVQALCHRAAAYKELGQPEAAIQDFQQALLLEPGNQPARYHLALTLGQQQRHAQAHEAVQALLDPREPSSAPAWLLAGQTLQSLGRHPEAPPCYRQALDLDPQLPRVHVLLGQVLQLLGNDAEAAQVWRQALEAEVDVDLNRYLLAAMTGTAAPATSPPAYVHGLFDPYADDFDEHLLQTLHYRGHQAVVSAAALHQPGRRWRSVLDLGCGTGLCGKLIRPQADRLTGVDLSETMIQAAQRSGVYDQLITDDIGQHLQDCTASHDLVLAADVFIYIGDLLPVFARVRQVLQAGGLFCFTVETPPHAETGGAPYVLRPSLRYAHSETGLRDAAQACGLHWLDSQPLVLREEQGQPVTGSAVSLRG